MRYFILLFSFSILSFSSAIAQNINGRLVTSAYAWQRPDYSKEKTMQFRAMETIQLDIAEKDIALRTYFQGSNDFGTSITGDPRMKFYNLYLEKKNLFDIADFKIGRVPVFSGMGIGAIDGAYIKIHPYENRFIFSGYLGGVTPTNQSLKISNNFSDNMMFGFQLSSNIIPNASIALSYMNRRMKPQTIKSTRMDTAFNLIDYTFNYSSPSEQYGSLDIYYLKEFISINGKMDFDFLTERLYRGEASVRYSIDQKLSLSAEFSHKEPRVIYNSIFSVFSQEATNEFGGGVDYLVDHKYNVFVRYSMVQYTDENASRLMAGINCNFGAVTYTRNFGYVGDLDNLSIQALYPLMNRKIVLNGGVNFSSYKPEYEDKKSAAALVLGGTLRTSNVVSFDLQGQLMINDVYKNDFRIYFKFTYRFLSRLGIF